MSNTCQICHGPLLPGQPEGALCRSCNLAVSEIAGEETDDLGSGNAVVAALAVIVSMVLFLLGVIVGKLT